jgi:hypothetical protein
MVMLAGACSGGSGGAGPPPDAEGEWVAAELSEVPDGFIVCEVRQDSAQGRVVSYGPVAEGVGDNCEVAVTASTSLYGWSVDEAIALAQQNSTSPVTLTEVDGHRAMIGPMTDEGREYGRQLVWEQAPGLVIQVQDSRYENFEPVATDESVLALAALVVGMDRPRWDEALTGFARSYPYAGPAEGSTERALAAGEVDGRTWALSALVPPDTDEAAGVLGLRCLRLEFAGESTGPGCAPSWVVLGGTGFVLGWGPPAATPTVRVAPTDTSLQQGDGPALTDVEPPPQVFPVDGVGGKVWVSVLPQGTCTVVVGGSPSPEFGERQLWLLPADPGAAACATR